jgi:hypothetical protein
MTHDERKALEQRVAREVDHAKSMVKDTRAGAHDDNDQWAIGHAAAWAAIAARMEGLLRFVQDQKVVE